jgi:hypothetical protein
MPVPQLRSLVSIKATKLDSPLRSHRTGPTNSPARHPEMRISIAGLAKTSAANTHQTLVMRSHKGHAKPSTHSSLAHTFFVCLLRPLALFRLILWSSNVMKEVHALVVCLLVHPPRRDDEVCQLPKRELDPSRRGRQSRHRRRAPPSADCTTLPLPDSFRLADPTEL